MRPALTVQADELRAGHLLPLDYLNGDYTGWSDVFRQEGRINLVVLKVERDGNIAHVSWLSRSLSPGQYALDRAGRFAVDRDYLMRLMVAVWTSR